MVALPRVAHWAVLKPLPQVVSKILFIQFIYLVINPFASYHRHANSPNSSLYISYGDVKEHLFKNQELLKLVIFSLHSCNLGD